jgi:hypothetical protein
VTTHHAAINDLTRKSGLGLHRHSEVQFFLGKYPKLASSKNFWATAPATKRQNPAIGGFLSFRLGAGFEPTIFLGYGPSHNLKAEAVKKSLQWSDFKLKVEHGEAARRLRRSTPLTHPSSDRVVSCYVGQG